ncbi:MAG TPA: acyltransferase [Bacteroidetes bacterium]|nr:acyltransferase [Bacteroidota bacterium]
MESKRIHFIDFAKGFAIFTIVLFHLLQKIHLSPLFQSAIEFGGSGVHLFFMLSGFGLFMSKRRSPLEFYQRRFAKIYLPYFLVLTISLLVNFLVPLYHDGFQAYLAGIFLYQMFFGHFMEAFGGHFWFISTIIQLYLLYPLFAYLHQKLGDKKFLLLSLFVSASYWVFLSYFDLLLDRSWTCSFLQFFWVFSLGMVLANQYKTSGFEFWSFNCKVYILLAIVGVSVATVLLIHWGMVGKVFNDIPVFVGYTSIAIIAYKFSIRFSSKSFQIFSKIGEYSYSIYLVHVLIISLLLYALEAASIDRNFIIIILFVPFIFLASWVYAKLSIVFTRFIEKLFSYSNRIL